jgi:hypothetical protein
LGGLPLTVGLAEARDSGLVFETPKLMSFLFNHFLNPKNPVSCGQGLVGRLHYSKAKRGRHENQDEYEGWNPNLRAVTVAASTDKTAQ